MGDIAKNKVRISLVLDKSDRKILDKICKEQDRSLNYIINQAVKEYIGKIVVE